MDELLHRATNILVLGCGGGNLATRLTRLGKKLTIVDNNPISFVIAQRYFGLPDGLPLVVSDFRKFILDDDLLYDAIAIDVGGPDFRFDDEFDVETCNAVRARLTPGGRIVMNVLVANDIDPVADRIAARLAGDRLGAWIIDEQGVQDRNADHSMRAGKAVERAPGARRGDAKQPRAMVDPARQIAQSRPRRGVFYRRQVTSRADAHRDSVAQQVPTNGVAALDWRLDAKLSTRISRHGLLALREALAASAKGRSRNELLDWA